MDSLSMIPKQLKILAAALLMVSLGAVVLVKAENRTIEPIQSSDRILRRFVGHTDKVLRISFSPDGKTIVSASYDGTIKLWNSADGTLINTILGHSAGPGDVKFSPDGQMIASSGVNSKVKIWKLDGTLIKTFTGHHEAVTSVAFSPDGKTLASSSVDKTVILWNLDSLSGAGSSF